MGTDAAEARAVADELAIRNLVAAVAQLADTGALGAYLDLYTDDAVWEMPDNPLTGVAASRRTGKADIRDGVIERRASGVQGPGSNTKHVVTTVRIDVAGDTATGHAYWLFLTDTATAPAITSTGRYEDRFVRTSDGWKLAHRSVVMG